MFKILEAEQLSANVYKQVILAPRVAKSCEPGSVHYFKSGRARRAHPAYYL